MMTTTHLTIAVPCHWCSELTHHAVLNRDGLAIPACADQDTCENRLAAFVAVQIELSERDYIRHQ